MKKMLIKYLGTSAAEGLPGAFCMCEGCKKAITAGGKNIRLRSSILINNELMLDIPPDFVYYRIKYALDISLLKMILITHTHHDHFNPQILGYNSSSFALSPVPLKIFLSPYAKDLFLKTIFEKRNALNNITLIEVEPFKSFVEGDYTITPLEAAHNTPQSLIYLIDYKGIKMLYGNDTGMFTQNTFDYLQNIKLDIVSLDGTMGKKSGKFFRHMSFDEIISLKKYLLQNKNCDQNSLFIATHFSHFINMLHKEIEELFKPYDIITAFDGMEIEKSL